MSRKRTLDSFFSPVHSKKPRIVEAEPSEEQATNHATYPFPIPQFPPAISNVLGFAPADEGKAINDQPDLDLLYFQPYIPKEIERSLYEFLRTSLFFYRVKYTIKRGGFETVINTPRWTTVFGLDATSGFAPDGSIIDSKTKRPVPADRYPKCRPRPIPKCLNDLRILTEGSTGCAFNFCLVNYYADGADSISYHSDDERFLGPEPAIASFSLGGTRDFLMKHKPDAPVGAKEDASEPAAKPLKLPLASGDMVLMRGRTQSNWLHSIPKRKGGDSGRGRINITFRKALVAGGAENYYRYNVGDGPVYKWDKGVDKMALWQDKDQK